MTTSERRRPLGETESQRLGEWMARELGEGPGAEAIATQRLRLARSAPVSSPPVPLRARFWAVSGGVLAAAAVVGGIVVVGKLEAKGSSTASRHPGISAEPLLGAREHGETKPGEPNPADAKLIEARSPTFTWRVSKVDARSPGEASLKGDASLKGQAGLKGEANGIQSNQRLEATTEPVLIELSDGDRTTVGRVEFGLGARINVARVDASELAIDLEQGIVETELAARASRVLVQAGPYVVRSLSTEPSASNSAGPNSAAPNSNGADLPQGAEPAAAYGVQWAPRAGALRVEVTRGEVEVVVEASSERHVIAAGKSLNLVAPSVADEHLPRSLKGDRKAARAPVNNRDETPLLPADEKQAAPETAQPAVAATPPSALPLELGQWRTLAENGQYAAAVKEAERVGFGTLEQNASPSDLLLLADVARLGGAPQRARSVLTSLRSRYPGHTNSAVAAFTLGRIAQEQEHDDRRAIQWYRTYLKEEPKGRMSEGARARLLKATLRVGSDAERDQAARDYLANHPTGSSAAVARSVLSK